MRTPDKSLAATAERARRVLDADAGWPTYHAGIDLQSLAMAAMFPADRVTGADEQPDALCLI